MSECDADHRLDRRDWLRLGAVALVVPRGASTAAVVRWARVARGLRAGRAANGSRREIDAPNRA